MARAAGRLKMFIKAGEAAAGPPLGPALGQRGVNIMEFVKQFNAKTATVRKGVPIPTTIDHAADGSFKFSVSSPPVTYLIKQAAGLEKGASKPGREVVGKISVQQVYEIGKIKAQDSHFQNTDLEGVCRSIAGTAKTMGVQVVAPDTAPE